MKISLLPMEALLTKLGASSTGFNKRLADVVGTYLIKPFTIEFPSRPIDSPTKTFLFGQLSMDDIVEAGIVENNFMMMYVADSVNQNEEKPRDFSGVVRVALDTFVSFTRGNVNQMNFEALGMAVEDALGQVIQPWDQQNWGAGVIYNGAFSFQRGAVRSTGNGVWFQPLALRLAFQVDVGG